MPLITIEGGKLDDNKKQQLITEITKISSEIMNIPEEFFMITIKELSDKNIGIGGRSIDLIKKEYK